MGEVLTDPHDKVNKKETFTMVQWLRICLAMHGMSSMPEQGTKIPHTMDPLTILFPLLRHIKTQLGINVCYSTQMPL